MALKQVTIPVVGCIRCGDDGPPLVYGDQVRLVLDQDIVSGLPPYIFGVIQPPITQGSVINPVSKTAVAGTYYIVEYQSDDLLGKIMELEPCFVNAVECVSNAEVLVERMRKIEECLLRLEVTVTIHQPIPAPDPFAIVSDFVVVTYIDKAGVEQTQNIVWNPEPGNTGPFTVYPEYGASLVSVAFSDTDDTDAGYSLSATSLLTCPLPASSGGVLASTTSVPAGVVALDLVLPPGADTSDFVSATVVKQIAGGASLSIVYVDLTGAAPRAYLDSASLVTGEFAVKSIFN